MGPVIVIVIVIALAWVFLAIPWRRRQRSHLAMQDAILVGDEIITAGGIHAVVLEAEDHELRIEIAPGVVVTLDRRAVAAVAQEPEPEVDESPDADAAPEESPDAEATAGESEAAPGESPGGEGVPQSG
jgi:preprotein translocase subunit YajC